LIDGFLRPFGSTATPLVVRIPMRFQRRGGRERIVAPDGSEIVPANKPQPDGMLVKALARAWRWQKLLDDGVYTSVSEIGEAERISKSYISRILRLALLAPDIVEAILAGRTDQVLMLEKLGRPMPASWEEQRRLPIDAQRAEQRMISTQPGTRYDRRDRASVGCAAKLWVRC
jgi:hypothetical protein